MAAFEVLVLGLLLDFLVAIAKARSSLAWFRSISGLGVWLRGSGVARSLSCC